MFGVKAKSVATAARMAVALLYPRSLYIGTVTHEKMIEAKERVIDNAANADDA